MAPSKPPKAAEKMPTASEAGQMPPTDANATRQRYQMGCHAGSGSGGSDVSASRQRTSSRQFNRGSTGGRRQGY